MSAAPSDRNSVDDFLKRLEVRPDAEVVGSTYTGRALSRSEDALRLSIESGVVSIPLKEIAAITPLRQTDPSLVQVEVRNIDEVTHVVRADGGQQAMIESVRDAATARLRGGPIILTGDTDTVTGGRYDACDDTIVVIHW